MNMVKSTSKISTSCQLQRRYNAPLETSTLTTLYPLALPKGGIDMKLGRTILGRLLKLRRTQLRKTVYQIASDIGVSHNAISYFESGQLALPGRRLSQFSHAYQLDARDLMAWYLITKLYDEGVGLETLEGIAPQLDRIAALLGWQRGRGGPRGPVLDREPGEEPPAVRGDIAELQRDFIRSIQTLQRMRKRGDFPVEE